jgi:hypothetical protein
MKSEINAWLATAVLALTALALPLGCGVAGAKPTVNPAGTWKLAASTNSQTGFQPTLKIRREGGKLVGTLSRNTNRADDGVLEDLRLQGSELCFTVTIASSGGGPKATKSYEGTISGDTIKGKCDLEFAGRTHTRDWEAKRVKQ